MSDAAIDLSALRKLKEMIGGDTEDLAELVGDFYESLPQQLSEMRTAQVKEDWSGLRIVAHSCKSNSRDLGAARLSSLCAELERQCKAGAPMELDTQLSDIELAANSALAVLKSQDLANV